MSDPHPTTFEEFWPVYVRAHSKPMTRAFHAVGTTAAVAIVGFAALTRRRWLLPMALVAGYGPAWFSHFVIEGNRPATFEHPIWSLRGDFEMVSRMLQGTMAAEVERCTAMVSAATEPSASDAVPSAVAAPPTPDRTFH